jgi:hypothetical protein
MRRQLSTSSQVVRQVSPVSRCRSLADALRIAWEAGLGKVVGGVVRLVGVDVVDVHPIAPIDVDLAVGALVWAIANPVELHPTMLVHLRRIGAGEDMPRLVLDDVPIRMH